MRTKTKKLSEKIITFIIENISGDDGRSDVTEESIAAHFRVSRTPVREVLKHLEHNGIIQTRRSKGIFSKNFTREDVENIYEVRTVLEELAAKDAVKSITPQVLKELRTYARITKEARKKRDRRKSNEADRLFHETIMELSGNGYLKRIVKEIRMVTTSFIPASKLFYLNNKDRNPYSHDKIVKALATRNPEAAAWVIKNHICWIKNNILESLEKNGKRDQGKK
ncbi:MAG: GntR family transcriptional regulator [Candidatus Omnitrophica bacterium]|nr:GntR family transcriptional regulator [Candidatus Omnitrophota bacterium]